MTAEDDPRAVTLADLYTGPFGFVERRATLEERLRYEADLERAWGWCGPIWSRPSAAKGAKLDPEQTLMEESSSLIIVSFP